MTLASIFFSPCKSLKVLKYFFPSYLFFYLLIPFTHYLLDHPVYRHIEKPNHLRRTHPSVYLIGTQEGSINHMSNNKTYKKPLKQLHRPPDLGAGDKHRSRCPRVNLLKHPMSKSGELPNLYFMIVDTLLTNFAKELLNFFNVLANKLHFCRHFLLFFFCMAYLSKSMKI